MLMLILVWCGLLGILLAMATRRDQSGVLMLIYALNMSIIHVPGAVNHLGSGISGIGYPETKVGFEVSLIGLASLLLGALILRNVRKAPNLSRYVLKRGYDQFRRLGLVFIVGGLISFFGAVPLTNFVPGTSALTLGMVNLLVLGVWIVITDSMQKRESKNLYVVFACAFSLPFITMVTGGFLGQGLTWLIAFAALLFIFHPKRNLAIVLAPLAAYLGLSFGIAYLGERTDLRNTLEEGGSMEQRFEHVRSLIARYELYDWDDQDHAYYVDIRFNQNYFVGLTVDRLEQKEIFHELGRTVPLWSLIPRAVWPEKPVVGGGRDLVENATGLRLDEDSSFGAGQPLEFYLNFGWTGVVIGFMVLGALLAWLDRYVTVALKSRNAALLVAVGLPGLALVNPGGNLMEIVVAAIAAAVTGQLILAAIRHIEKGRALSSRT